MIAREVRRLADDQPDALALVGVGSSGNWTYAQLLSAAERKAADWRSFAGQRVGLLAGDLPQRVAALMALDELGATACLVPATFSAKQFDDAQTSLALAAVDPVDSGENLAGSGSEAQQSGAPGVMLFTSGTSGPAKAVRHTWHSLACAVRYEAAFQRRRWLLVYDPAGFAGMQVILQALLTGGTLVHVPPGEVPAAGRALIDHDVEFVSATPTFWRMLLHALTAEETAGARLKQITLGGEAVDQSVLDALAERFPAARRTHIYASTEMGVCFSVHDGKAGFPLEYLNDTSLPVELRISGESELLIRSPRAMTATVDGAFDCRAWFATGDLVEVDGQRVRFVGRKSGTINVGGQKVVPEEVENAIRQLATVRDVRVTGISSSVAGQLVTAEVVLAEDIPAVEAEREILAHCRARLAKHKIPALIQFVAHLTTVPSGKLARSTGETT